MRNIENALKILEENIKAIRNVSEWAYACGFENRKKFSRVYRKQFGLRPKATLQEVRVQMIKEYLNEHPNVKNYCVALEFGFVNEQGLYKFLKRHTGVSPTELRKRIVKKQYMILFL